MPRTTEKAEVIGAIAVTCAMVAGSIGLIAAGYAFWVHDTVGAGVCLSSSALAFGLVANAIWRR